jgi:hypothetical protein
VLSYEARSFVPVAGDVVPCRLHGYCVVELDLGRRGRPPVNSALPRATPRAQSELLEWLRDRPVTTVHALRRQRFTLRMVAAAAQQGLVDLDLLGGRVTVCTRVRDFQEVDDPHLRL